MTVSYRVYETASAVVLTIHRPETKNALDRTMVRQLRSCIERASLDLNITSIVLTSALSDTVVSGGDIREFAKLDPNESRHAVMDIYDDLQACERAPLPIIAAVGGNVFGGGCELLLMCDLVILETQAQLSFRHVHMGLLPGWGGLFRLVERASVSQIARYLYTGEWISAEKAEALGIATEIVPTANSLERSLQLAQSIGQTPRNAVTAIKSSLCELRHLQNATFSPVERANFFSRWGSAEHTAAMEKFVSRSSNTR